MFRIFMNRVVEANASKQVHGLPGSQNTLSPHWLYFFVLAGLFCLCFAFFQQVCALWLKETKGNLCMRKCIIFCC